MLDKIRRKILYIFPVELSTEKAYNKIVYIGRICRINYTHRRKKALTLTSLLLSVIMLFSLTIFAFAIPQYQDLEGYSWATEAIYRLYRDKIMLG